MTCQPGLPDECRLDGDILEKEEQKGGTEGEQSESGAISTTRWGVRRRYCSGGGEHSSNLQHEGEPHEYVGSHRLLS